MGAPPANLIMQYYSLAKRAVFRQNNPIMKTSLLTITVIFAFACSQLFAQIGDVKPGAPGSDSIAAVLQANTNQTVELHLKSGEKIGGKVTKVGTTVVHLSQVTGMELFDADIEIADISAIVARAKKG